MFCLMTPHTPGSLLVFSLRLFFFFFNDTATTEIYTLSLHDALPISLHETRHGHAARFDLPIGDPAGLQHFQTVISESQLAAAPGFPGHAAALLLAVLHFLWHQHKLALSSWLLARSLRLAAHFLKRACGCRVLRLTLLRRKNFALVDPTLHANHAVGSARF